VPPRIGIKPGQWGWSFAELRESWRAAEEAGFDLVSCFDHVTAAPAGLSAWDAPSLLVAMGAVTERVGLCVDVLNASLRHPFLLAGQLAVAHAVSGGRVEVGLGAGSFHLARFDHRATGIPFPPFPERIARLEACCRALPALWRGEEVTDRALGLERASLGPIGIEPPTLAVGGKGERAMEIAARYADRWNSYEPDPAPAASLAARMEEICARVGRDRPLARTSQVFVRDVELADARDLVRRLEDAGVDTVVFVLDREERGPDWIRRVAGAVL
jgi:alkanesulfonate monooxygenase SsuD/methylene tetrahydromethanopterin reductase-like flavin-dependent oxidoreductase (luciferase family)